MVDGSGMKSKKNVKLKKKGDGKMPEEEIVNNPGEGTEGDAAPEGEGTPEAKSEELINIKSKIDKMEADMKSMDTVLKSKDKEIQELKAIVEKARPKAKGAENSKNKDDVLNEETEVKSVGPLDYI